MTQPSQKWISTEPGTRWATSSVDIGVKHWLAFVVLAAVMTQTTPATARVVAEHYDSATSDGYRGAGLGVEIERGGHWGLGRFLPIEDAAEEAWFRYMLILDRWQPSQSGKLPGFSSLRSASARGCVPADEGSPGWSARVMYRPSGAVGAPEGSSRLGYYVYHLDQPGACGEIMEWSDGGIVEPGVWNCIEGHVRLNDPDGSDGSLTAWVNGVEVFDRQGLRFRSDPDTGIDDLWLNVFSGGKDPSPESLRLRLDEVMVGSVKRIGCPDAFDDDEADPNEGAINRMAALGAVPACGEFRVCPEASITRAEFAGMVVAATGAEGEHDRSFTDTDGHPYADQLSVVAEKRWMAGCGDSRVCPDDPMRRGDAALVIARAFELPDAAPAFIDVDDGPVGGAAAALHAAGVASGCASDRFCPDAALTKSAAAAMISAAYAQQRVAPLVTGRSLRPDLESRRPLRLQ